MLLCYLLLLISFVNCRQDEEYFPFLKAKCQAGCYKVNSKLTCINACLKSRAAWVKPGECPENFDDEDIFGQACLNACKTDSECLYTRKCCPNSCGVTCQQPEGLDRVLDLPDRLVVLNFTSNSHKKKGSGTKGLVLAWPAHDSFTKDGSVVLVLEARSHIGRYYSEHRLSDWSEWPYTQEVLDDRVVGVRPRGLKFGTWYQFRTATVCDIGSRGFSELSEPFTPTGDGPKAPAQPTNVHVEHLKSKNMTWILKWDKPTNSDLPVMRYKVFWSRRIEDSGSLLVRHHTLTKDATSFVLRHLQPDSQYFLQVQALSQFGRVRLKSDKAAVVLNTTVTDIN